jgi:hypothetical protein
VGSSLARRLSAVAPLLLLVAISTVVRSAAALRVPSPWFVPDELVYGELGKSLYRSGHFEILGATPDFFGLVYPVLIGAPLALDVEAGYRFLKPVQALVMSLTAVPVYLWGRSLMPPRYALLAATLTLCVPGLAYAGFLMTEVAFYPVLTLAAWAMARALARATVRAQALLLAALFAAVMTRLQALALIAVLALAAVLAVGFARTGLRALRPLAPLALAIGSLAILWIAAAALSGGNALGAYGVTSEHSASRGDSARFVLYHAADLLLLTAVVPVLAFAVLVWEAVRGRERSRDTAAFLAVTVALALVSVAQVGVYAATWVGRLAERNLLALAPLFFLAFSLWLARGALRPRSAWGAFAAAFLVLGFVPWNRLAVDAAIPDAFSIVPFNKLVARSPGSSPALAVPLAAFTLGVAWLLVPRRLAWILAVAVAGLLAGSSVIVSRVIEFQARAYKTITVGSNTRWIDGSTAEPVAFLYAGERGWSGGGPVWLNLFWNSRIERVYALWGQQIVGPVPVTPTRVEDDGRLVRSDGRSMDDRYVATASPWTVRGQLIASSDAGYRLWQAADGPLRFSTRVSGARLGDFALGRRARLTVYDCTGGTAVVALYGFRQARVQIENTAQPTRSVQLRPGRTWTGRVRLTPVPQRRICQFDVVGGHARLTWFMPERAEPAASPAG